VSSSLSQRYLDLLKRTVTGTIYRPEPDHDSRDIAAFVQQFKEHYFRLGAHAMVPLVRLDNVADCVATVVRDDVPGDLIEAGVWRGGTAIFMRGVLAALGDEARTLWVADSFEGLPVPDTDEHPKEARAVAGKTIAEDYDNFAASFDEVRANFEAYGFLDERTRFLKGWFADTLPTAPIDQLSVVRLDGDLYQSTMDALVALYPKVASGGFVIIDDYAEDLWTDCRQAVDEFRAEHGIVEPLVPVDSKCAYWRRARAGEP
jgi:hypothetical protein